MEDNSMIINMSEKTGKTLEEWLPIVQQSGLVKHREIINFLKAEHGLTYGYANLIAHKSKKSDAGSANSSNELIDQQYQGKASLRPIYDALIKQIQGFGEDLEVAPKRAYVSLRRKKQFALIQPSTKSRVDVGINLKGKAPEGKLEAAGSFNSMVSHRVRLSEVGEIDTNLIQWLKEAFEMAG